MGEAAEQVQEDAEEQIRRDIEDTLSDSFFESETEDMRNSYRLVLAAIYLGTNADKLARFLGLNRDKFVRPRAKRLRESGIFIEGTIGKPGMVGIDAEAMEGDDDRKLSLWLVLAGLIAEGLVVRREAR